jgi:hypothetical protein
LSKRSKVSYWHKKQGKASSPSAQARHASVKQGRSFGEPPLKLTPAEDFVRRLKEEIRRAV